MIIPVIFLKILETLFYTKKILWQMIFYFLNFAEKNPFLIDCAKEETITKRILKMRCQ
jgi:hypothetical protein